MSIKQRGSWENHEHFLYNGRHASLLVFAFSYFVLLRLDLDVQILYLVKQNHNSAIVPNDNFFHSMTLHNEFVHDLLDVVFFLHWVTSSRNIVEY